VVVAVMLGIDLGIFNKKAHQQTLKEAAIWSAVWIGLALIFNAGVAVAFGGQKGMEFLAAYLIEKSLSVDNIFVFVAIFTYFHVEGHFQHRVLFWGIIGALVMRGLFIWGGLALIQQFHWIIYVMGAFLVITGLKLVREAAEKHPEKNPVIRFCKKFIPMAADYHGESFFIKRAGKWLATPLFLVLVVVEMTDVIFAVDSVPAVLAVSHDPFIAYTSNVFAILGLRALYFVLAGVIPRFVYLRYGLCAILVFVGLKMVSSGFYHIPIAASLAVIASLLAISVGFSLYATRDGAKLKHTHSDH
jgi:tellurite resistance protein TerC